MLNNPLRYDVLLETALQMEGARDYGNANRDLIRVLDNPDYRQYRDSFDAIM